MDGSPVVQLLTFRGTSHRVGGRSQMIPAEMGVYLCPCNLRKFHPCIEQLLQGLGEERECRRGTATPLGNHRLDRPGSELRRGGGVPLLSVFGLALGQTTVAGGWANPIGAAAVLPTMCLGRPVIEARQHLWRGHLSTGPAGKSAEVQRCAQTDQIQRWGLGEPPARPKGGLALAKAVWTHCLQISRF